MTAEVPLGCLGPSQGDLWELLGRLWVPLGGSLGSPWALLGDSGDPLGIILGGLGVLWEPSEPPGVDSGWFRMCGAWIFHDFPCFARLHLVVLSAGFLTLVPHRMLDPTLHAERVACCLFVKPQ